MDAAGAGRAAAGRRPPPARRTCCWRAASRAAAKSRSGWPSAPAALGVVRQMLIEAGVWALLGAAVGLPLATNGRLSPGRADDDEGGADSPRSLAGLAGDGRAAGLALITAAGCAVLPALTATRLSPGTMLNQRDQTSGVRRRWSADALARHPQVAVTMVLLAGAALFVRSLQQVLAQDAGVEREAVLVLDDRRGGGRLRWRRGSAATTSRCGPARGSARRESASLSWYPPISDERIVDAERQRRRRAARAEPDSRRVYFNAVSPGYFDTVGTALVKGREFRPGDIDGANRVAIVNESLVRRFLPGQDPIGRRITIGRNASRRDLRDRRGGARRQVSAAAGREPSRRIPAPPSARRSDRGHQSDRRGPRHWISGERHRERASGGSRSRSHASRSTSRASPIASARRWSRSGSWRCCRRRSGSPRCCWPVRRSTGCWPSAWPRQVPGDRRSPGPRRIAHGGAPRRSPRVPAARPPPAWPPASAARSR